MKKKISIFLIVSMILSMTIYPILAFQDIVNKQLDVVLVLDQSGSMKKNDPDGLMKEAAKTLITMMPSNSRANVITFNRSRAKWKDRLTSLSNEKQTKSATEWIDGVEYTGDTDLGNAVSDAVEMFDENDGRTHAILVFSDGKNDFGYEKGKEKESDERLSDALVIAKNTGIQIYCIGYGSEMANISDTPYQKLDSVAIADSANRITTKTDAKSINDYFNLVIAELMESKIASIVDNKIEIAPNVKEANINIISDKEISDNKIKLIGPDGKEISFKNSNAKLFKYKYSAVIKLYEPETGVYTIKTSDPAKIIAKYIPYYEYTLKSSILDSKGKEIKELNNGQEATIKSIIQQDNKDVVTSKTYANLNAVAIITAKDTKESKEVKLNYLDGYLTGKVKFDHVATYSVEISVESESFKLVDSFEIITNQQPITINNKAANKIGKQVLDKTFKQSVSKTISMSTLKNVIEDPDHVGFKVVDAISNNDNVAVKLTDKGLEMIGNDWGSANVTVTYEDNLGNRVDTSFAVKVTDKVLLAFYMSLPILAVLIILLIVIIILRKSRIIKGKFTINSISLESDTRTLVFADIKTYPSNVFFKSKKTLSTGLMQYAKDIYNQSKNDKSEILYNLIKEETEIKKALDAVKFIGTYLGRHGCKIKINDPNISYGSNMQYGQKIKDVWKNDKDFTFYVKDNMGLEVCITGHYSTSFIRGKESFDSNMDMFTQDNQTKKADESFEDFDDLTF